MAIQNDVCAIATGEAPAAIGPYSQAVVVGGFVFVSGQLPIDPETGALVGGSAGTQTVQSLANVARILAVEGLSLRDVVKTTVLLADIRDFATVNAVYSEKFVEEPLPARSAFQAAALPKGARVEIEVIARKPAAG